MVFVNGQTMSNILANGSIIENTGMGSRTSKTERKSYNSLTKNNCFFSKEEGRYKNNVLVCSTRRKGIMFVRSSKLRERIEASVEAAKRAADMGMCFRTQLKISLILFSRTTCRNHTIPNTNSTRTSRECNSSGKKSP